MSGRRLIHFCWIGPKLSWAYAIAILSAAAVGGADEIILHHTEELETNPSLDSLRQKSNIKLSLINPQELLRSVGLEIGLDEKLWSAFRQISKPAILSDILRAAILYRYGGIYLDMDTVTVGSLANLFEASQFIGVERIVWPYWIKRSRSPFVWGRVLGLDVTRKILRIIPEGWRFYRYIEGAYFRGINGAVMGGKPKAPLFEVYLRHMVAIPSGKQMKPNVIGPDLLQELIGKNIIRNIVIHDPEYFYPIAPEISEHWFRPCRNARQALEKVLSPNTVIVHWYGSVRSKRYVEKIDPHYIRERKENQLYSAIVSQILPDLGNHEARPA